MEECYRHLILNSEVPIIFRESLHWEYLTWSLQDWSDIFRNQSLKFRCGERICRKNPYWESACETEYHTMDDFVKFCSSEKLTENRWWYFDYKHINEYFTDDLFRKLSWSSLGFPEKNAESSTLWIGSPGANTPCHFDTYGCNLVAQVFGRKRWLLFPPAETKNLKPTRVPYEESSVYSNINFSCYEQFKDEKFENVAVLDLYPGDVLFVPPKWWHYVENLSLAISINTWIPRKEDDLCRLEEALIRYFMSSFTESLLDETKKTILNPNELDMRSDINLDVLNICKHKCKTIITTDIIENSPSECSNIFKDACHNHNYNLIRRLSDNNMKKKLFEYFSCYKDHTVRNNSDECTVNKNLQTVISFLNAFCHPDVISHVTKKFLEN